MAASRDLPIDQATKKIIVVDDHPMSREGIVAWIVSEPGWEVSNQAETAEQALDAIIRIKPDVEAIRHILTGQVYVSQDMSLQILETFANKNPAVGICRVGQLTDREFEVFQLAGQGLSSTQIARRLLLSIKTVQAHRANIKSKLQIKTTPELISYAAIWLAHQTVQRPA